MKHLLVLVIDDVQKFPVILKTWEEICVGGITIIDSIGSRRLRESTRDDLPLMTSLRALLESQETHNRMLFTVVDDEHVLEAAIAAAERIVGDFSQPGTGILFTVPVERALGLIKKPRLHKG